MEKVILFMDNMPDYLNVHAKLLERAHYRVHKAGSVERAEKILNEKRIHLAILDIRMEDEDDAQDMSGLLLAKKVEYQCVPKIILTAHDDDPQVIFRYVRDALGTTPDGLQPAVDFIVKLEGADKLVKTVDHVFAQHVPIKWDMTISWNEQDPLPFSRLVALIDSGINTPFLSERADEMEDLFRKLFYEYKHIRLERVLWQRNGRLSVLVHAFRNDMPPKLFIVVCGEQSLVSSETRRYREFGPNVLSETTTMLDVGKETIHFSANRYGLAPADSYVQTLHELYTSDQERLFRTVLNTLFEKTLADWHQGKRILEHQKTFADIYRQRLLLAEPNLVRTMFQERVQAILRQIPALNLSIKLKDDTYELQFGRRIFSYVDPTDLLFQEITTDLPVVLINTPGMLSGTNIVTNEEGRAWVTDFLDAGFAPSYWNFAILEAIIRFDWVEISDLQRLHEMERCLAESRFNRLDLNMVEPIVKKPLRAIQRIRQLATPLVGEDELLYYLAVFYHAASRIAKFEPDFPQSPADLRRLAHILIAMSILREKIQALSKGRATSVKNEKLYINKAERQVWVRDRKISVLRDSYRLLEYLYDHSNQVCERGDIAKDIFQIENYDKLPPDEKKLEVNRMNTAIHRLREKIEDNPDTPRYLITREGIGYCLVLSPDD